ncbi:glycosyltransferase family 1 protein [Scleroderma yunnanense]
MANAHLLFGVALCLFLARFYLVVLRPLPRSKHPPRGERETCSLGVFLGSGGHTGEALTLASALDFSRYYPRTYIVSDGDALSAQKAVALEYRKAQGDTCFDDEADAQSKFTLLRISRARRVHQPLLSATLTAFKSFFACVYVVAISPFSEKIILGKPFVDLLIMNGPGTCVPLCAAVMLSRLVGLPTPTMVYVESYARVRTLSLSGKILRYFVDRFIVQWHEQVSLTGGRGEYYGCLV